LKRPVHGGNLTWAALTAGCPPTSILDFSASINPLGPPATVLAAIENNMAALCQYPDPSYSDLREVLGQFHDVHRDWILPGNGSAELLTWACRDLAKLQVTYLMTPAFGDYWRSLRAFEARVLDCDLNLEDSGLTFITLAEGTLGLYEPIPLFNRGRQFQDRHHLNSGLLINNPHNPTGRLFVREMLLPYLDKFALVVIDEAFMDFLSPSEEQSAIAWVKKYPNLVILRSLTKFYSLPGLRCGYAIAHPDRLKRWQHWRDPWPVNGLAVAAAMAAVQDVEFQEQTWKWLPAARAKLWESLAQIPGLSPYRGAANFLLIKTEESVSKIQQRLLKRHQILIRDCLSFPELGDRYFRVAVRSPAENQKLVEALTNILS
jgi:L-threonine-O-3-phosphate decarboxylase